MKKSIFTLVAGVLLLAATSCKKDYTCDCPGFESDTVEIEAQSTEIEGVSKADAEDSCEKISDARKELGALGCTLED